MSASCSKCSDMGSVASSEIRWGSNSGRQTCVASTYPLNYLLALVGEHFRGSVP